ncbi:MAG: C25 family cysteine peptidase [Arcicella sp.]|nr:C25 family cysteine peptidase [Arcicella sp.]
MSKLHRPYLLFTIFFTIITSVNAQDLGNEWINYDQSYFKIKITQKGIYQLTFQELKTAGFPIDMNPQKIQLFRRGKEQAIYIKGEEDKIFNESDFIEFYAEGNDGSLDSLSYSPMSSQPHQYYSLYSDTASYFLTYNIDNQTTKRFKILSKPNSQNLQPEPFHWEESLQLFTSSYNIGQPQPIGAAQNTGVLLSDYSYGKGWTGDVLNKNTFNNFDLNLRNIIKNNAPKPKLEILFSGCSAGKHSLETYLGEGSSQRLLDTTFYENYLNQKINEIVEFQDIVNDKIRVSTRSVGLGKDQYSVSYLKLNYPQSFDMTGVSEKYFNLVPNTQNNYFITIPNVPLKVNLYDLSDKNSVQKITFSQNVNELNAIVEGTKILATNQFKKVNSIEPISFRDITNSKANYLIISHKSLFKNVKKYANYRASVAGGKYDTLTVDVDLLYNLFTYGDKNPLAIKRFLNLMSRNGKPEFLFIIGNSTYPQKARKNAADYQLDLVPNIGYPGADIPFGMGLNNNSDPNFLSIPVGRLATNNPEVILYYLNKVKEHETNPLDGLWRKNTLQMSGGRVASEHITLKDYTIGLKEICENGLLGQKVDLLTKKTDNPVEFINVTERINQGVGVVMMFGHSAPGQTDMDIGYASNDLLGYKNKGKYPLVLVNGCDAGDLFATQKSFGTDWINTPDRGAILFLAHSNLGYPYYLKTYSDELYKTQFADSLFADKPFGTVMKETVNRYLKKYNNGIFELGNAQQFTLQGDPAVALFPTQKPDFEVNNSSIFLENVDKNNVINSLTDSVKVGIIINNLGRISTQKMKVNLKRIYPNGTTDFFEKIIEKSVTYQDTVLINISNNKNLSLGNNRFEISLDVDNQIVEFRENNNQASLAYNFPSANIAILSPKEFSIMNQNIVKFVLQIPISEQQNASVIIEIDSSKNFNSSYKKTLTKTAIPLLYWQANLLEKDSTVYYIRTQISGNKNWVESSFIYIKNGLEGFAQYSIPQLAKTTTDNQILLNEKGWFFPENTIKISAKIHGGNSGGLPTPYRATSVILNDKVLLGDGVCYPWSNFNAVAFNRALRPYSVLPSLVCGYTPYSVNYLDPVSTDFEEYLNATPTGNYVMMWSSYFANYAGMLPENKQRFAEIGADVSKIQQLTNGSPFFVVGRKGAKKALLEVYPEFTKTTENQILNVDNLEVKDSFNEGQITSSLIGPASEWGDISLKINKSDPKNQSYFYEIIGLNQRGDEEILQKNVTTNSLKISSIDAKKYPFLKLKLTLKTEEVFGKSPQLSSWMVTYKGVPEGVIDIAQSSKISDKQEYEDFTANVWFKNISNKNFNDSITVRQVFTNRFLNKTSVKSFRIKALLANDSVKISVPVKTAGLLGENTLSLFFNPEIQPEQIYNNNSIDYVFNINPDKTNPVLSVKFDGRQIQSHEVVSAKPVIEISLKDENLFRIKTDTLGMDLWLKSCKKCAFKKVYFNNPEITWQFDKNYNDFIIRYLPKNLPEDTLTLQVQGRDVAGNPSGTQPYTISFIIKQKQELKSWVVYPNPFNIFTKFSFTLTGEEISKEFNIEIYDAQGQVLKNMNTQKQSLHIGINEFVWDGTDNSGVDLPVGTYFYRLVLRNKSGSLQIDDGGKIVIFR